MPEKRGNTQMCDRLRRTAASALVVVLLLFAAAPRAGADRPGDFSYWLLALSWTPAWCAAEGDARGDSRCAPGSGRGWTLHGLWPQHEAGWPEFCRSPLPDPTHRQTMAMADIMGSSGLAWHQWRKHGRCSGLAPGAYFDAARAAYSRFAVTETLAPSVAALELPGAAVLERLRADFSDLPEEAVTLVCRGRELREIRICLDRAMTPRACGADVAERGCRPGPVRLAPLR